MADASIAYDDAALHFPFPALLNVPPGAVLSYRFTHPTGTVLALWLGPNAQGTEEPALGFTGPAGANNTGLREVFRDETTAHL